MHKNRRVLVSNRNGFTLIEVIVVAAIIAVLAGILVPMIFTQIDEGKKSRAAGDVKSIQTSVGMFRKDMASWPIYGSECSTATVIKSDTGTLPTINAGVTGWNLASQNNLSGVMSLVFNEPAPGCYAGKKGQASYISGFGEDPWGYAYIINSADFANDATPIWVLSPGPDGIVKTNITDTTPNYVSDTDFDIGVRIR